MSEISEFYVQDNNELNHLWENYIYASSYETFQTQFQTSYYYNLINPNNTFQPYIYNQQHFSKYNSISIPKTYVPRKKQPIPIIDPVTNKEIQIKDIIDMGTQTEDTSKTTQSVFVQTQIIKKSVSLQTVEDQDSSKSPPVIEQDEGELKEPSSNIETPITSNVLKAGIRDRSAYDDEENKSPNRKKKWWYYLTCGCIRDLSAFKNNEKIVHFNESLNKVKLFD